MHRWIILSDAQMISAENKTCSSEKGVPITQPFRSDLCLILPSTRTPGLDREDISCWTEQGKLVDGASPEPEKELEEEATFQRAFFFGHSGCLPAEDSVPTVTKCSAVLLLTSIAADQALSHS